jgi:hypothetical protein
MFNLLCYTDIATSNDQKIVQIKAIAPKRYTGHT